ncbi:MAG: FkbM family methyltransferase [Ignavibacteriae bacterium]|nr:FkbM family methyltransferase [Ignavibacteriota bacterium]
MNNFVTKFQSSFDEHFDFHNYEDQYLGLLQLNKPFEAFNLLWNCYNFSDQEISDKKFFDLIHLLDIKIDANLFTHHYVKINVHSVAIGGSWLIRKGQRMTFPEADDANLIVILHKHLVRTKAKLILDIGANSGSFSLLPKFIPELKCIAFEPNEALLDLLHENLRLNGVENQVEVFNLAASDINGRARLHIPNQTGKSTLGTTDHLDHIIIQDVRTVSIDNFLKSKCIAKVDAIKIDTEGHDFKVLMGAMKTIVKDKPILLIESVDYMLSRHASKEIEMHQVLENIGYTIYRADTTNILAIHQDT